MKNVPNISKDGIPFSPTISIIASVWHHCAALSCKHAILFLQSPFQILVPLPSCRAGRGGAVANSVVDIVFQSSARDTIACLAKSAKASIGLLRRHYDVCNIVVSRFGYLIIQIVNAHRTECTA